MIESQRLRIIPFHRSLITSKYINWLNDPDVNRFSHQKDKFHTMNSCLDYLNSYANSENSFWAIVEICDGHGHIGNITATFDKDSTSADVGILIGEKQLWSQGYGLEAWMAVCDFLICRKKILKTTGGTVIKNKAMLSFFRKVGMREQPPPRVQQMIGGELHDSIRFELLKETD